MGIAEFVDAFAGALATEARLLHAAEGGCGVRHRTAVDANHSGFKTLGRAEPFSQVFGEDVVAPSATAASTSPEMVSIAPALIIGPQSTLASKPSPVFVAATPAGIDTFFYANSGAEISEAAIKLAKQATGRPHTIVFEGSFHGRTHMAMAMTTSKNVYRAGYAPLPSGVFTAPFPDLRADDLEAEIDASIAGFDRLLAGSTAPSETACVIIEPKLGEGGYRLAPKRFLETIAQRCAEHRILFIADEVQSGFARTGKMFAIEYFDIEPDVICMAKGIASGFPFSALGTRRDLDDKWPTGSHGGTYGGNAIGCAAALATIDIPVSYTHLTLPTILRV